MKPQIAFSLTLFTFFLTIFLVIQYPSVGIQVSCGGFLLNLLINIFTKETDSN